MASAPPIQTNVLIASSDDALASRIAEIAAAIGAKCVVETRFEAACDALATGSFSLVVASLAEDRARAVTLIETADRHDAATVAVCRSDDEIDHAFSIGASEVIRAPISAAELRGRFESLLGTRAELAELAQKRRDAQVMVELTQALASTLDARDILATVVKRIAEVVRVDRASIVLAPENDEPAKVVATSDEDRAVTRQLDLSKYPEIQQVLRTGEPLTIADVATHPVLDGVREDVSRAQLTSLTLLPIRWADEIIGVLFLRAVADRGALSARELSFSQIIANATGAALKNARTLLTLKARHEATLFARMEAETAKSFLEKLIAASPDAIVAADMKGTILLFNAGAERIYGYRSSDAVGKMNARVLYPGNGARDVMRRLRADGRIADMLSEAQNQSGERIPIALSAAFIYEGETPVATFAIFTDLRERLLIEKRLEDAQMQLAEREKQAYIAELAGAAAHELNQPLTSILAYAEMLKRRLSAMPSEQRYTDVIYAEAERIAEVVRKIGRITKYETTEYVGTQRIIDLDKASRERSEPPKPPSVLPRSRTAPSREQVLESLLHLTRIASGEFDPVALIRVFLGTMSSLFPHRRFAVQTLAIGGTRITLTEGTTRMLEGRGQRVEVSQEALDRHALGGKPMASPVVQVAEGYSPFFAEGAVGIDVPLIDGGSLLGIVALEYEPGAAAIEEDAFAFIPIALELGSLLRVSKLLRESRYQREYLATLLEHSANVILGVDENRRLRLVNRSFLTLSGFEESKLLGQDFVAVLPETQHEALLRAFHAASRGEVTPDIELRVPKPGGGIAKLALNVAPVLSADGDFDGALAIGRDLTIVRELEEQIIQAEKLATLGQLAAGVVHEINNPLTSISVYAEYLLRKGERSGADPSDLEKVRRILEGVQRILNFTRDLIVYARPSAEEARPLDIEAVIEQAIVFCDHVISEHNVVVERGFERPLPALLGVRSQLHQVFINLFTNASQAIGHDHGKLRIATSVATDGRVVVSVTDNGAGIPDTVQSQIFEPFFTTKKDGTGTGLGLSIVRNILRAHGAELKVQSSAGVGTTFTMLFRPSTRD